MKKIILFLVLIVFISGCVKENPLEQMSEPEVKCPDGICDEYELKEGLCAEDCEGVEGWVQNEQPIQTGGGAEVRTSEDAPNYQEEKNLTDEEQIADDFNGESFCGDGFCDDESTLSNPETHENCPQDCAPDVDADEVPVCGDGICSDPDPSFINRETYENCPQDCAPGAMAEMNDIIPETPEEEKQMDITFFVTLYPTCYFDAGASIANYMENLSYDEFIWHGRPINFKYDTRWDSLRTGVGGSELVFESFYNLGYKAYNGKTEKRYPVLPGRNHMRPSSNFIFFDTNKEAWDFVKRLMSADIPVMVALQGDYHIIKGYNKTHIFIPPYMNLKTEEYIHPDEMPLFNQEALKWKETQILTYDEFFSLWKKTGDNFYWFVKQQEGKTEQEMFNINKKDAEEAYDNVQKFIKSADFGSNTSDELFYTSDEELIIATASASRYLTKQGNTELSEKYMELATICNNIRSQSQNIDKYSQIAEIYKEAAELW